MDLCELAAGRPARERLSTRIIIVNHADERGTNRLLGLVAEQATEMLRKDPRDFIDTEVSIGRPHISAQCSWTPKAASNGSMSSACFRRRYASCCSPGPRSPPMTQIEHLLRNTIGLDASTIGSALIQRNVRLRMKSLGLKRVEDYKHLLETSRKEWAELVETVVVTETSFRDREPFGAFVRLVLEEWLPFHPAGPLRLLSLPCSSGEEPIP